MPATGAIDSFAEARSCALVPVRTVHETSSVDRQGDPTWPETSSSSYLAVRPNNRRPEAGAPAHHVERCRHKKGGRAGDGSLFPGWSRGESRRVVQGPERPNHHNRNLLPPHRYLQIETWTKFNADEQRYVSICGWAQSLEYPAGTSFGLKALTGQVLAKWSAGTRTDP